MKFVLVDVEPSERDAAKAATLVRGDAAVVAAALAAASGGPDPSMGTWLRALQAKVRWPRALGISPTKVPSRSNFTLGGGGHGLGFGGAVLRLAATICGRGARGDEGIQMSCISGLDFRAAVKEGMWIGGNGVGWQPGVRHGASLGWKGTKGSYVKLLLG